MRHRFTKIICNVGKKKKKKNWIVFAECLNALTPETNIFLPSDGARSILQRRTKIGIIARMIMTYKSWVSSTQAFGQMDPRAKRHPHPNKTVLPVINPLSPDIKMLNMHYSRY